MGTKRRTTDPAPTATPVDRSAVDAALRLFATGFVVAEKRTQIHARLVAAERRLETLASLPRWIAVRMAPLEGTDRSPEGLRARFGELTGIRLDATSAIRTTIAHALELGRTTPALFIGDTGTLAMITAESAAPILCSRI